MLKHTILITVFLIVVTNCALRPVSNGCLTAYRAAILAAHNSYRSQHQAAPMSVDTSIDATAQNYATYLASNDLFEHSSGKNLGENLAMKGSSQEFDESSCSAYGTDFAKMWYDEIKDYDWANPGKSINSNAIGHFTQVVWKDSTQLGCGIGVTTGNSVYGVCNYSPAGNYLGQYAENVLKKA